MGPSGPSNGLSAATSTTGSLRRAAAIASPSRVWAFSFARSPSDCATFGHLSASGSAPGEGAAVAGLGLLPGFLPPSLAMSQLDSSRMAASISSCA